jgi:hypothetical protein
MDGMSRRAAAERFGIDLRTVAKMLKFSVPPGYMRTKPPFREYLLVISACIYNAGQINSSNSAT